MIDWYSPLVRILYLIDPLMGMLDDEGSMKSFKGVPAEFYKDQKFYTGLKAKNMIGNRQTLMKMFGMGDDSGNN